MTVRGARVATLCAAAIVSLALASTLNNYWLRVGSQFFLLLGILAGLHVVTGLARVISLCHAALVGVGAYTAGLVAIRLEAAPLLALAVGGSTAALMSLALGSVTVRLNEHHLALATLAASEILSNAFRSATALTGGANGLSGVPAFSLFGVTVASASGRYMFAAILGISLTILVLVFERSLWGKALRAAGDEGPRLESLGVSIPRARTLAFAIGGLIAGTCGSATAFIDGFVGPESFGLSQSIAFLCFLVIGGLGSLRGVLIGACVMSFAAEWFRALAAWQMIVIATIAYIVLAASSRRAKS